MRSKAIIFHIVMLAVTAVLLRALIPVGYMPDLESTKGFEMVICTASGAQTIAADANYDPLHKTPVHHAHKLCDFALTHINGQAVALQSFALLVLALATAYLTSRKEFTLARRRYYSAQSPRAPPISV